MIYQSITNIMNFIMTAIRLSFGMSAIWSYILQRINCNGGIREDDGDVDIETITEIPWSVDMTRHRIQNIYSSRGPLLINPILMFKFMLRTSPRDVMLKPSGKSVKISVSQASENSAARCQFTLGQKPQLFPENKLTKVFSPPKYTAVHNSVRSDSSEATPATTVRSTVLTRRTNIKNPAVKAIDKVGSYHHYLHRKINLLISTITSYTQSIDRGIQRINLTLDLYSQEIENEITMLKLKVNSNANDLDSKLKLLGSKIESYDRDLHHRIRSFISKIHSYVHDLHKKITSLNSNIASYDHDFEMQIMQLNSKTNLYRDLFKKFMTMIDRSLEVRDNFQAEFEELKSETVTV